MILKLWRWSAKHNVKIRIWVNRSSQCPPLFSSGRSAVFAKKNFEQVKCCVWHLASTRPSLRKRGVIATECWLQNGTLGIDVPHHRWVQFILQYFWLRAIYCTLLLANTLICLICFVDVHIFENFTNSEYLGFTITGLMGRCSSVCLSKSLHWVYTFDIIHLMFFRVCWSPGLDLANGSHVFASGSWHFIKWHYSSIRSIILCF